MKLLEKLDLSKVARSIKVIAFYAAVALLVYVVLFFYIKSFEKKVEKTENEFLVEKKTYKPAIGLPFGLPSIGDRQPVKTKVLPIKKEEVKMTIEIDIPVKIKTGEVVEHDKVNLVVDKEGNIYKTKDFPEEIKVKVTEWKPAFFSIKPEWGCSLFYDIENLYLALSLDMIGIKEKFYIGGDAGINLRFDGSLEKEDLLIGISGKVKLGRKGNILIGAGKDILNKRLYGGLTFRF